MLFDALLLPPELFFFFRLLHAVPFSTFKAVIGLAHPCLLAVSRGVFDDEADAEEGNGYSPPHVP
jgi:hypothetical protein